MTVVGAPPKTAYTLDGSTVTNVPIAAGRHGQLDRARRRRQLDPDLLLGARLRARSPRAARTPRPTPTSSTTSARPARRRSPTSGTTTSSRPSSARCSRTRATRSSRTRSSSRRRPRCGRPGFADAFQQQLGYSLLPYLPLVAKNAEKAVFNYTDAATPASVRRDINLVLDQPLQRQPPQAAEGVGQRARAQVAGPALGLQTDAMQASSILDIPEGESLGLQEPRRLQARGRRA